MKTAFFNCFGLVFSGFLLLSGCAESGKQAVPPAEPMVEDQRPDSSSWLETRGQTPGKQEFEFANPMKYAQSEDTLKMWGLLCQYSKWGKELQDGQYTLLCPSDNLLKSKGLDILKSLKKKENADLLDQLVASHILKTKVFASKWKEGDVFETIDGRPYTLKPRRVQELIYYTYDIETRHGNVVLIEGVIDYPEKELRNRLKKGQK